MYSTNPADHQRLEGWRNFTGIGNGAAWGNNMSNSSSQPHSYENNPHDSTMYSTYKDFDDEQLYADYDEFDEEVVKYNYQDAPNFYGHYPEASDMSTSGGFSNNAQVHTDYNRPNKETENFGKSWHSGRNLRYKKKKRQEEREQSKKVSLSADAPEFIPSSQRHY